ncbi:hypothetical protein, partial [Lactobacillus helveticus]
SVQRKRTKQPFNDCLILFIYSLSTGFDKEPLFCSLFFYAKFPFLNSRQKSFLFNVLIEPDLVSAEKVGVLLNAGSQAQYELPYFHFSSSEISTYEYKVQILLCPLFFNDYIYSAQKNKDTANN